MKRPRIGGFAVLSTLLIVAGARGAARAQTVISGGPHNDYESWIERLHDGRLMVVFCRNPDWSSGDLYVSFSADDGLSWNDPAPIITKAGDQATLSFVQMPSDTLRLYFASNETGLYKIRSAWSLDALNWTDEGILDLGWGASYQYYDPTVELEAGGSLTMSYVVMGNGVFVAHCPPGGQWDTDRRQVAAAGYRPRIMKHTSGPYLCAYHARVGGQYEYDVFVRESVDLTEWSEPVRVTTNRNSHDPFVCEMFNGPYMVTYAKHTGVAYNLYCRFSLDTIVWGDEFVITEDPTNNTQPHILPEQERLYLTYAHAVSYPTDHDVYLEVLDYTTDIDGAIVQTAGGSFELTSFPNPFNGSATVRYTLSEPSHVTLAVYDLRGRRIRVLVDEHQEPGGHSVALDVAGEASGVYFCRLQADRHGTASRLLLVK